MSKYLLLLLLNAVSLVAVGFTGDDKNLTVSASQLFSALDIRMNDIRDNLNRAKPVMRESEEGFIILEPESPQTATTESINKVTRIARTIDQLLQQKPDKSYLEYLKKQLHQYVEKLEALKNSVSNVALLITENPETLYTLFELQSLSNLERVGVDKKKAYEVLGFAGKNRYGISLDDIEQRYKNLSEQHGFTTTEKGRQVRQAGFTLANEYGKKIYDAYLTGPEALQMLAITPEDAAQFGISFEQLAEELITYKNIVDGLIKKINKLIS